MEVALKPQKIELEESRFLPSQVRPGRAGDRGVVGAEEVPGLSYFSLRAHIAEISSQGGHFCLQPVSFISIKLTSFIFISVNNGLLLSSAFHVAS